MLSKSDNQKRSSKPIYKRLSVWLILLIGLLFVVAVSALAVVAFENSKPIHVKVKVSSSGGFAGSGDGTNIATSKKLDEGEAVDIHYLRLKLLSYNDSSVNVHLSTNVPNNPFSGDDYDEKTLVIQ